AHWRLYAVLCRHVSGEHQSLSLAPSASRRICRLGEGWERKLLRRLKVRSLRICQSRAAVRPTLAKVRAVRVWTESGKNRARSDAASDCAKNERTHHVGEVRSQIEEVKPFAVRTDATKISD